MTNQGPARNAGWLALAAALLAGLYARFDGLGLGQLAVDEYYFVRSCEFVLATGLPRFPEGGYYVHGLLQQYLTAAAVAILGSSGLAWRLVPALASLASAGLAYLYARKHVGRAPAAAVAGALLVSSWEVEFGRFARMYAPFQCATLLFLLAAHTGFVERRPGRLYWPHLACAVAALAHVMTVLFAPLLFLPLLDRNSAARASRRRALAFGAASAATLFLCYLLEGLPLRVLGAEHRLPEGLASAGDGSFLRMPELPYFRIGTGATHVLVMAATIGMVALALIVHQRRRARVDHAQVLAATALVAAVFHALAVVGICLAVLALRHRTDRSAGSVRSTSTMAVLAALVAAAWLALTWTSAETPGRVAVVLFGWPDYLRTFALPWLQELPLLAVACVIALAVVLRAHASESVAWWVASPPFFLCYVATCIALLDAATRSTRYTFFVYPVLLVTIALGIRDAVVRLGVERRRGRAGAEATAAVLFALVFLASSDFNPAHLAGVGGEEASFRSGRFAGFDRTWYPRFDYRDPARFVNEHATSRDGVVVLGEPPVSYYLAVDHAVFYERDDPRFRLVARRRGTRDVWSDRRLLSTSRELEAYAAGYERLWIVRAVQRAGKLPAFDAWLAADGRVSRSAMRGRDGRIEVVQVGPDLVP